MLSGATLSAAAIVGTAVFRIVVSSDSMKNATATSQGTSRKLASLGPVADGPAEDGPAEDGPRGDSTAAIGSDEFMRVRCVRTGNAEFHIKWRAAEHDEGAGKIPESGSYGNRPLKGAMS